MPQHFEGYVTKFAPHKILKLIAWGKLTFDKRVVLHRVVRQLKLDVQVVERPQGRSASVPKNAFGR